MFKSKFLRPPRKVAVAVTTNSITQTPEFKSWFGASKVVDNQGNPLKVYHGTDADIEAFNTEGGQGKTFGTGAFFTSNPSVASSYGKTSYPVYLCIKHPLVIDAAKRNWDNIQNGEAFIEGEDGFQEDLESGLGLWGEFADDNRISTDDLARIARDRGYDGLIVKNVKDTGPGSEKFPVGSIYVVFNPNQVKSSVGNSGKFDPANNNITAGKKAVYDPTPDGTKTASNIETGYDSWQDKLVDNPKFKTWFSGSKVTDSHGRPLLCYHGTAQSFSEFDKSKQDATFNRFPGRDGFFFTSDPVEASDSADWAHIYKRNKEEDSTGPNIQPVYLSIKNPYVRKSGGEWTQLWFDRNWQALQEKAKAKGCDGIIIEGTGKAAGRNMYLVYEPTQIKSAIGNSGNFDPNNHSITAAIESNESLINLLEPQWGGNTGPEKEKKLTPTVSVFISQFGSYRFVKTTDGKPVAAVQIMSRDKKSGYLANMYVLPEYRRQGIMSELTACARKMFKQLTFSDDLSNQGQAFVDSQKTAGVKLYHGSKKRFNPGFVLTPQADGYAAVQDDDIRIPEEFLEKYRPGKCLPRARCVFMVGHSEDIADEILKAGGYDDYVYEVEPIGRVEKSDLDWYSQVSNDVTYNPDNPAVIEGCEEAAQSYWSGAPSARPLWEYRAPRARIIRMVKSNKV